MVYPAGYLTIWHQEIVDTERRPRKGQLRLAMTSDEARSIGEKFLQIAASIESFGGTKQ